MFLIEPMCQNPVLIETLWNVKKNSNSIVRSTIHCINRNIVECKAKDAAKAANGYLVLIETLWNVKYYGVWRDAPFYVVLIETLWNVKNKSV